MKKIRNKLLLVLILVTLLPTLLIGGYSLYSTSKALRENVLTSHANKVSLIQERIENLFNSVDSDVFYLRDSNALHLYLSSSESEGGRTQRLLLKNLQSSLEKFSAQKKIYQQVRFLDTDGQEIVRIDQVEGNPQIITDTHLQNKASRYYFTNTLDLDKDELFISALDLNREKGEVIKPLQPIVRYSTPVFDKDDILRGVIVLSVNANHLIALIEEQNKTKEKLLFIDLQGFYYYHSDNKNKAWGGKEDLDTGENLFKDNADIVKHLKKKGKLNHVEIPNGIVVYTPISINHKDHVLGTLLSIQSKDIVLKPLKEYLIIFLSIGLVALLLAFILAVMLSNSITRPLVKLKEEVESLSLGDMDTPIKETTKDEVGDLAHAIELLRKSMKILMKRSR